MAIWWTLPQPKVVDVRPVEAALPARESAPVRMAQEASAPVAVDQRTPTTSAADRPPPPTHVAVAREPATAPALVEKPDMEAIDKITIRVVDDQHRPVMDAEVTIRGMRREGDSGSWYGYRGDAPAAKTDAQGRVELNHWRWVTIDGRTRAIDVAVVHPDFVAFRDSSFEIGPGEHVITLQRGATVVVSGWLAAHPGLITQLKIQVDRDARLSSDAWVREADGRLSTTRIAPGTHLIWLEHESAELGPCFSEIEGFELAEHEWKELAIELHAAETLDGALDPIVPRPIVDGHVMLSIQLGGRGADEPSLYRRFESAVRADGTFAIERLPRGRGQLFALCRGWVSKRTLADSALDAGIQFAGAVTPERESQAIAEMGDRAFQLPRVAVPSATKPLVIAMERTATIEIVVKLADGSALADADAGAAPNISLIGVGSSIAPWRTWHTTTDGAGLVRIEDLPPTPDLWISARHTAYQMLERDRKEPPGINARSGETTRAEIVLEPKDK